VSDVHTAAYRVTGPTVGGSEPRRVLDLVRTLAYTDWKLRFFGSALGYVWSLLRPLFLFGILYVVFSEIVQVDAGIEHYPVLLLIGVIAYYFFAEVTGSSVTSLLDREALLRKVGFPRVVVPLSVAAVATLNLVLNLVVLAAFLAIGGVEPRWEWLLVPIPLVLLAAFSTGVGMGLSVLFVSFRDIRPIWEVLLQALFYATPIFYPVEKVAERSEDLARVVMCNPLATLIQQLRHYILGSEPSAATVMGGTEWLLIPAAIGIAGAVLGALLFRRRAPRVAEEL
jgi:ABC-2 type transport system permease protein